MSAAERSLDVARDLLRRARIRLVDEPDAKGLDAEIVAFLADKALREDDEPRPSLYSAEPWVAWRGSASDFATDMRSVIAPEKMAEIVTILADKTLEGPPREYTREENFAAMKRLVPPLAAAHERAATKHGIAPWDVSDEQVWEECPSLRPEGSR